MSFRSELLTHVTKYMYYQGALWQRTKNVFTSEPINYQHFPFIKHLLCKESYLQNFKDFQTFIRAQMEFQNNYNNGWGFGTVYQLFWVSAKPSIIFDRVDK